LVCIFFGGGQRRDGLEVGEENGFRPSRETTAGNAGRENPPEEKKKSTED